MVIEMETVYLLFGAIIFKLVYTLDLTCFDRLCYGPKFRQSNCCDGFICVALYKPGREDVLECVDEEEHFRPLTMKEILEEVDREYGESDESQNQTLLLEDMSLSTYMAKIREVEDHLYDIESLEAFNNPVLIEKLPTNKTM